MSTKLLVQTEHIPSVLKLVERNPLTVRQSKTLMEISSRLMNFVFVAYFRPRFMLWSLVIAKASISSFNSNVFNFVLHIHLQET